MRDPHAMAIGTSCFPLGADSAGRRLPWNDHSERGSHPGRIGLLRWGGFWGKIRNRSLVLRSHSRPRLVGNAMGAGGGAEVVIGPRFSRIQSSKFASIRGPFALKPPRPSVPITPGPHSRGLADHLRPFALKTPHRSPPEGPRRCHWFRNSSPTEIPARTERKTTTCAAVASRAPRRPPPAARVIFGPSHRPVVRVDSIRPISA
jgi:hypothetical protein